MNTEPQTSRWATAARKLFAGGLLAFLMVTLGVQGAPAEAANIVTGRIVYSDGSSTHGIPSWTVVLRKASDDSAVDTVQTDSDGYYSLYFSANDDYYIDALYPTGWGWTGDRSADFSADASLDNTVPDMTLLKNVWASGVLSSLDPNLNSTDIYYVAEQFTGTTWSQFGPLSFVGVDGSWEYRGFDSPGLYRIAFYPNDDTMYSNGYSAEFEITASDVANGITISSVLTDLPTLSVITGQVLAGGVPVNGADIGTSEGTWTTTNALGEYTLTVPVGVPFTVSAEAPGYLDQYYPEKSSETDATVLEFPAPFQSMTGVDFNLVSLSSVITMAFNIADDDFADPLDPQLQLHLYRKVATGYQEVAVQATESTSMPTVLYALYIGSVAGDYRVRLSDGNNNWYTMSDYFIDTSAGTTEVYGYFGCFVDLSGVTLGEIFDIVILTDSTTSTCAAEPIPPAPPKPPAPPVVTGSGVPASTDLAGSSQEETLTEEEDDADDAETTPPPTTPPTPPQLPDDTTGSGEPGDSNESGFDAVLLLWILGGAGVAGGAAAWLHFSRRAVG